MDKKLVSLSYDKLELEGEVNERLPRYNKNLIAHFPCDNTLNNTVPDIEIYVENNILKTKGVIANPIVENKTTIENNMIKFDGTVDSYMLLNKDILNGVDDFSVEIDFIDNAPESNNDSWLLSGINTSDGYKNIELGIYIDQKYNMANFQILNAEEESEKDDEYDKGYYKCSKLSTINKGMANRLKITRNNGYLVTTLNDEYQYFYRIYKDFNMSDIIIGQLSNKSNSISTHNFNVNNSFNGYISKIVINRCEKLFSYDANVTDFGTFSSVTNTNLNDSELIKYVWNKGVSSDYNYKIETTENKIANNPVKRVTVTKLDTSENAVTAIKTDYYRYGVVNSLKKTFDANTKYCSYILYKPISHKDMKCGTLATNIVGWFTGSNGISLGNGWYLAYKYRDGMNQETLSDYIYYSFYSPTYKAGDDIVVEVSPIFLVKDSVIPSYITYNGQEKITEKTTDNDTKLLKYINPYIDNFSYSFDYLISAHSTSILHPRLFWLGNWSNDKNQDWIGIYIGAGWSSSSVFMVDTILKDRALAINITNVSAKLGHEYRFSLAYNKVNTSITLLIYDKTDRAIIYEGITVDTNLVFNNFKSVNLNTNTNSFVKNVSFYNKTLNLDEMKSDIVERFSIESNGDIILDSLKEVAIDNDNSYVVPFGKDGTSVCGRLNTLENVALAPIEGGSLTGSISSNIILDLMRSKTYSEIPKGTYPWDYDKHKDALQLEGWSSGYSSAVTSPTLGYHGKIILEGIDRRPAIKLTDCNSEFGLTNRYMSHYRKITKTEMPVVANDVITVYFKAKSITPNSNIRLVLNRRSISKGVFESALPAKICTLTDKWEEFSFSTTVTDDWDTTADFNVYIQRTGSEEVISLVSDVMVVKNAVNPELLTSEILYNLSNKKIQYNLSNSIGMDWTKPWQIMYKKKIIDSKINALDVLGSWENSANNPYVWIGNYNNKYTIQFHDKGVNKISQTISGSVITNEWLFTSIKYDGIDKLTINVIGRNGINVSATGVSKITTPFISNFGFDLSLGTYQASPTAQISGGSIIKDLVILKNEYLSDEETVKRGQLLINYKSKELRSYINVIEK